MRVYTEAVEGLAAGGSLLLLTDYDGTLTRIVPDPSEARVSSVARALLRVLAYAPRVRVGVISGRSMGDLRSRIGVSGAIYAGCHGLEVEGRGLTFRHPEAEAQRQSIDALARALILRLASIQGARVDPKGLSVAVHYRNVARDALTRVHSQLEHALYEHTGTFKVLRGKKVVDILPDVHWNKGECALWIRDRLAPGLLSPVVMLYMGDDQTDELAFSVLSGKAVTARVGPEPARTSAIFRLHGVPEVHRLLSILAARVQEQG